MSGYARMKSPSTGKTSELTSGRLTRRRPRGAAVASASSSSAASISASTRRLRSRNSVPSAVSVTLRVLRWNSRTPSLSSSRATLLPTAEADTPSKRPAATKLRVSATCTNTAKPLRLSMMPPDCGHKVPEKKEL
ncbi:hypothetical protein D9M68_37420 [compost metagenome]